MAANLTSAQLLKDAAEHLKQANDSIEKAVAADKNGKRSASERYAGNSQLVQASYDLVATIATRVLPRTSETPDHVFSKANMKKSRPASVTEHEEQFKDAKFAKLVSMQKEALPKVATDIGKMCNVDKPEENAKTRKYSQGVARVGATSGRAYALGLGLAAAAALSAEAQRIDGSNPDPDTAEMLIFGINATGYEPAIANVRDLCKLREKVILSTANTSSSKVSLGQRIHEEILRMHLNNHAEVFARYMCL